VAPFVGQDDVQARGQTEPHTSNERVDESDSRQIDVAVLREKDADLILRG
jgi:hypothetical protein